MPAATSLASTNGAASGQTFSYSLVAGAGADDNASFSIDGNVLKTAASFAFEAKARLTIRVRSVDAGGGSFVQTLFIRVTNVNEPPTIISGGGAPSVNISVPENVAAVTDVDATDPDMGNMLTYSISGGADAAGFSISSTTGVLKFASARDFEDPIGQGSDNVYDVIVRVSDGHLSATQTIVVTVTDAENEPPRITSNGGGATASITVAENVRAVTDVDAIDPDAATFLYYSVNGTDAASFLIDSETGVLTFKGIPNFENPTDSGGNNVYDLIVTFGDGLLTDTQTITIKVTNVNEPPVFELKFCNLLN